MSQTARKRLETERNAALKRRLELYKNNQVDEYRELVKEQIDKEDLMNQKVMAELMEELTETNE